MATMSVAEPSPNRAAGPVPPLIRAVPADRAKLVLEFGSGDVRLFDCSRDRLVRDHPGTDWTVLAHPEFFRHLTVGSGAVHWAGGVTLDATYLFVASNPLTGPERDRQFMRVAYRNQAPTPQHPTHHVYYFELVPFGTRPFLIGESINGGHGEMGGATTLRLTELLAWPGWEEHLALAGCDWAVPLFRADGATERAVVDAVVSEVCRRADTPDSDIHGYQAKPH